MTAPTEPAHLDHAVKLYLAGKSLSEIRSATGVSPTVLHRERGRRGIPPTGRRLHVNDAEIVAAYLSGESEYAMAIRTGISRTVVRHRLLEAGVEIRRPSEAGLLRASKLGPEQRAAQAARAHAAVLGRKMTAAELEARARRIERNGRFDSEGEKYLAQLLEERDLLPVAQKAIGKYNVDMAACNTVAVEVLGGNWHAAKRTHATRSPHILNAGWHLILVWNQKSTGPITAGAADYVAAFCEQIRWQPALVRQYRVVSGSGETLASRCADDDEFPLVPPSRRAASRRS